jgi:hypothetical protein
LVGRDEKINACLVGTTTDGVVLAFRGTLSSDGPGQEQTIRDWINDLDAELVCGDGLPGLVHAGFWGWWTACGPPLRLKRRNGLQKSGGIPNFT